MKKKITDHNKDDHGCQCSGDCENCTCLTKKNGTKKTKNTSPLIAVLAVSFLMLVAVLAPRGHEGYASESIRGEAGLLIIAHGAPWEQWNKPVLDLEKEVAQTLGKEGPYKKIKVALMEFSQPSVADGVKELEEAGCSRIVAVPLLIAPSSHSHWDIPALLGIYSSEESEKTLTEEGATIIRSKIPITVTPTIGESDVIEKILLKKVMSLSKHPDEEALVLVSHGDPLLMPHWERLMKKTVTYICGKSDISYGDWASIEMGQDYEKAVAAISLAAQKRKRIIVVGAYLSMGVEAMHKRWLKQSRTTMHGLGQKNPFDNVDIAIATEGLLPDSLISRWIADVALSEIRRNQ
ncbi:MAG TPA: CbiX/SirB N-terminal domain-containing protein [Spirochaetota bacterium]|nr:CbiX/SirB N-terminal domain-containing protein [Spirochaetota bacterium]HPI91068.1 CbiX/SirB N-terminal domain-containing protein [Spirochaetota bacterium]HPR49853.1 CbiX/SirB N-terminal domain-containing protein [Spirochaetota bacterium]